MSKRSTEDVGREVAKRSRRELLAGVAAGAAGAMALSRPTTAYAGTDGDVVLGGDNVTAVRTRIENTTATGNALEAYADGTGYGLSGASQTGIGVGGYAYTSGVGVDAGTDAGRGVFARSHSGEAVYGRSGGTDSSAAQSPTGIHGVTDSSADSAVWGENLGAVANGAGQGGNGVYGSTDSTGASGVYGHNAGTGFGVAGRAESGVGTLGDSTNGTGILASSENGTGLSATTTNGTALSASTGISTATAASLINTEGGIALSVTGKALFNRSGSVSITYPAKSATVAVPGGLSASALVLAIMQNAVSGIYVASAVPNTSTGKATINLNKAPGSGTAPKTAKVAWFVVN
jgi:hypothetical protein